MKKILYSVFALTMAAFTFTSCEDVPAPYDDPNNNGGGQELPEGVLIDQSFTSSLGDFTSKAASGNLNWYNDFSSAMVTGYQDFNGDGTKENQAGVTFLVGPEIDFTDVTEAYVTINHAVNYEKGDINTNNSIVISKDYTGDVTTATWQVLKYNTDGLNADFTFVEKSVNIPSEFMGGKAVIALRHTCNASASSTWEVKSLRVQVGKVEEVPDTPDEPEGTPEGDGTLENPFNAVAANNYASSLAAGDVSDKDVYIKGKIASIKENFTTQYGNASFYISDDGSNTNTFYVFRTLYLNNVKYTEGTLPQVGDDVIICGKVTNYMGNTPETMQNQSYIYSLTSNGGGETPDVPENSITLIPSELGLANGTAVETTTLSDGTVLTFDGGGNQNAPKYYDAGTNIRIYPKNSMTIKSTKKIAQVIINCDTYNNVICNASGDVSADPGTVDTKDAVITINDINNEQTVITNTSATTGTASQIRMTSLTIVYAE